MRLPLGAVNLFGMHIIPPLTIYASTHFIYPPREGGLSQPLARLSQEWVLNLGPLTGRSTALTTELSQLFRTVGPYNHQSLQAEHGIKSLATILMKHLTGLGQYWSNCLSFARLSYNTFCSPNINGFSPYDLFFWKIAQSAY